MDAQYTCPCITKDPNLISSRNEICLQEAAALIFEECDANLGQRHFYNSLPSILGRLLYAYLHQLSGADEVIGELPQLVTSSVQFQDSWCKDI
jgi:hypothetical protein